MRRIMDDSYYSGTEYDSEEGERAERGNKPKRKKKLFVFGSILIGVAVLLLVYFILIATGVIRIRANELTFSTASASRAYDGTPLSAENFELVSGSVPEGYTADSTEKKIHGKGFKFYP